MHPFYQKKNPPPSFPQTETQGVHRKLRWFGRDTEPQEHPFQEGTFELR